MKSHRLLSLLLIAFAATVLTSCQKPYHEPEERYVFIASNINLPYWQEAQAGLQDASRQMGVKAEFDGPEKLDPQEELKAFQKAVDSKPSGILVSVARPDVFQNAINAAIVVGIPVIAVDADAPETKRVLFIGTDNFRAGQESAKRMAQILQGHGQIAVIVIPGQQNVDERLRGVNEALKKYPDIKIAQTIDDSGDTGIANDKVSTLLHGKTKIDGIISLEASGGEGAAEAVHRQDLDGKIAIVAFDKNPETLDWIERGVVTATVTQKPYVMAYYGLKFADDLHHNAVHDFKDWKTAPTPPLPTWVDTGTAIVDKTNVKAFREALAAHPKPVI
jgi:ribose transport system substrate-binding protein